MASANNNDDVYADSGSRKLFDNQSPSRTVYLGVKFDKCFVTTKLTNQMVGLFTEYLVRAWISAENGDFYVYISMPSVQSSELPE